MRVRLKLDKYLELRWAGIRLLETFRLIGSFDLRQPNTIDTEKVFVQFLRLVLIDVLEEIGRGVYRIDWTVEVWQKIRAWNSVKEPNSDFDPFSQAIRFVSDESPRQLEWWAKKTEEWAREEMRKRGTRIDERELPLGEISFRIMRICCQFHNTIVSLYLLSYTVER